MGTDTLELTEHQFNALSDTTDTLSSNTQYILLAEGTNPITGTVYQSNSDTVTTLEIITDITATIKSWSPVTLLIRTTTVSGDTGRKIAIFDSTDSKWIDSDGTQSATKVFSSIANTDSVVYIGLDTSENRIV